MVWWQWMIIALVLAGLEMATPGGFFVVFFGAGALVVGFLGLVGLDLRAMAPVAALLLLLDRRAPALPRAVAARDA